MITRKQADNIMWLASQWASAQSLADAYKFNLEAPPGEYVIATEAAAKAFDMFRDALNKVTEG
jgi:hypothetical protein